eukprot:TRINITY_DN17034_c0_g1_i1.p1 TRINITY_DN17034_c0_g1~~TRINITY_DN17034_c0_g1_i1.p1  ORF type:complete len:236 (+),score=39.19 TRINITY_DN17034_c0_g1_i1:64-771(+)
MVQIVGLTGGIACGKSTISKMVGSYKAASVFVVDADEVSHRVMETDKGVINKVREAFGGHKGVMREDGGVNREALGEIVFADPSARKTLVKITQGPIFMGLVKEIVKGVMLRKDLVILDIPLLFETKIFTYICEATVVTSIPYQMQLDRLIARNHYTKEHGEQRIAAAMPTSQKEKLATYIIRNDGTLKETEQQVVKILDLIRSNKRTVSPLRVFIAFILLVSGGMATAVYRLLF